jgi:hypothetical protein
MNTPEEDARDQWYSELVAEVSAEAIEEFTFDRLRSYYLEHRSLAEGVVRIYREAKGLKDVSPSAAVILFVTAIELGLKITLLKPVIYGLVHNEAIADLISDLAVKQSGLDRIKPVLTRLFAEYTQINIDKFSIDGHQKTMWEEITLLQNIRNSVVHRGELAKAESAELAQQVVAAILTTLLVSLLNYLGLSLNKMGSIEGG